MTRLNVWEKSVATFQGPALRCRTLAAFNCNIDALVHVNTKWVERLVELTGVEQQTSDAENLPRNVDTQEELVHLLFAAMCSGKSHYGTLGDGLARWCREVFADDAELRIGGQAGIIANLMHTMGADSRIYTTLLSPDQAQFIDAGVDAPVVDADGVRWEPVRHVADPEAGTKVNWIFEYPKGLTCRFPQGEVTTPRANRVILSTNVEGSYSCFVPPVEQYLAELAAGVDVAFMAGYHRGSVPGRASGIDEFVELSRSQLAAMKEGNPHLVVHIEYVPARDPKAESALWTGLGGCFDSFGINEHELPQLLSVLGETELAQDIRDDENSYTLWRGARRLQQLLRVPRLHLHNLGYYVLLLEESYPVPPEIVRESCLLASTANAAKALHGEIASTEQVSEATRVPLSPIGEEQITRFANGLAQAGHPIPPDFQESGIVRFEDHTVVVMPAHVVPNPVSTVGMGDTISSISLAAEVAAWRAGIA